MSKKKEKAKFKYFKKWKDHPDILKSEGEPVGWFEVDITEVFERLSGCYRDVDMVLETLHSGHPVNTPFSIFKSEKVSDKEEKAIKS